MAQKLWLREKNLVGFVLFVDEAGLCCLLMRLGLRGGVQTVQEEGHGTSFLSFTKLHLPIVNNTLLIAVY